MRYFIAMMILLVVATGCSVTTASDEVVKNNETVSDYDTQDAVWVTLVWANLYFCIIKATE